MKSPRAAGDPPERLQAELGALAVEMVAAYRAGVEDGAQLDGLARDLERLINSHPEHASYAVGYLLNQLAGIAAHALEQWDLAAFPMTPGTVFLAQRGAYVSAQRSA